MKAWVWSSIDALELGLAIRKKYNVNIDADKGRCGEDFCFCFGFG